MRWPKAVLFRLRPPRFTFQRASCGRIPRRARAILLPLACGTRALALNRRFLAEFLSPSSPQKKLAKARGWDWRRFMESSNSIRAGWRSRANRARAQFSKFFFRRAKPRLELPAKELERKSCQEAKSEFCWWKMTKRCGCWRADYWRITGTRFGKPILRRARSNFGRHMEHR